MSLDPQEEHVLLANICLIKNGKLDKGLLSAPDATSYMDVVVTVDSSDDCRGTRNHSDLMLRNQPNLILNHSTLRQNYTLALKRDLK